uniref:40S ribosomal protein S5 n=1 Tax=Gymnochlora stellata TaxID=67809 RepID=B5A4G7_GYMST|nr:40S ribosomal protein S5 [Gymnochlora stellata]
MGIIYPHSAINYSKQPFKKSFCPIVERLVCSLLMGGRNTGKKTKAISIVENAFLIINMVTKLNPIYVLLKAILNIAPLEDAITLGGKGTTRRESVDISPYKRVSQSIYLISIGTKKNAFKNTKSISECLADEIINAFKNSTNSYSINKKNEIERIGKASR